MHYFLNTWNHGGTFNVHRSMFNVHRSMFKIQRSIFVETCGRTSPCSTSAYSPFNVQNSPFKGSIPPFERSRRMSSVQCSTLKGLQYFLTVLRSYGLTVFRSSLPAPMHEPCTPRCNHPAPMHKTCTPRCNPPAPMHKTCTRDATLPHRCKSLAPRDATPPHPCTRLAPRDATLPHPCTRLAPPMQPPPIPATSSNYSYFKTKPL